MSSETRQAIQLRSGSILSGGPLHEVWYAKLNELPGQRSLWIGISLLASENGFRRVAEAWAVQAHRSASREVSKVAVKQTFELDSFLSPSIPTSPRSSSARLGECELRESLTRGTIRSKGQEISWDLTLAPRTEARYELIPAPLRKFRMTRSSVETVQADAVFSGTIRVNGEVFRIDRAPGMQGHCSGSRPGHSWVRGHCNSFVTEQGQPGTLVFEGITARARLLGPMPSPWVSSLSFIYQDKTFAFHSLKDALRIRSSHSLTEWKFQAERGDIHFRGTCSAEHKDFAGLTFEDTNGSLIFCSSTNLADMRIHVYRRGKLEAAFHSASSAGLEIASRTKNPYVPLLL
ncbi:MAG: hypothetical protein NDJ89_04370 [Oligoflexia bacterium]|nr:hypothetical protein [Oligoflexia bacterium]